jgi:hypothetical protein
LLARLEPAVRRPCPRPGATRGNVPATGINLWAVETSEASQANARIFNRFFDGTAEPMLFAELIYGTTVHHTGAQHDLQQNVPRAREKHSFQFALTGTGAFFGVLR